MAKNGFKIMDSDMHIMEPPDLWQRYTEAPFRHLAPQGVLSSNVRDLRTVHPDGKIWGSVIPRPLKQRAQHLRRPQLRAQPGHYKDHSERGWPPEVQLEAMDREGLDVAVLYPTRGLHTLCEPNMEPRLAAALARAYNNWLYDFCSASPDRLFGAGMVSPLRHRRRRRRGPPLRHRSSASAPSSCAATS